MSRTLDTLLRPSLLAVAIALSAPLASTALIAAEQASSVRAYNLPAAPLASTLNQIASQGGLALTLSPALASGKTSAPVQGQFDAPGALREASPQQRANSAAAAISAANFFMVSSFQAN